MHRGAMRWGLLWPALLLVGCVVDTALQRSTDGARRPQAAVEGGRAWGNQFGWPIDDAGRVLIGDADAARMVESGARWVRLHFRLGPHAADDEGFYAAYDEIVARLRGHGLRILGLISNESWRGAQADWNAGSYEQAGGDCHNAYIDGLGYAFARMAARWEGQVEAWEIWNEPNAWTENPAPGVFRGGSFLYPSCFAALLTHCHSQVHHYNDIAVQVVSGGVLGADFTGVVADDAAASYLDETFRVGVEATGKFAWARAAYGSYPLDAVGQHVYVQQGGALSPPLLGAYLDQVQHTVSRWTGGKPTWVTELGWSTAQTSEAQQRDNLAAAVELLAQHPAVAGVTLFQLDDQPAADLYFGLVRADGSRKPAFAVLRERALPAAERVGLTADGALVAAIREHYERAGGAALLGLPRDNGGGVWAHLWDYGYVQDFDGGSLGPCAIFDTGHWVALGFWQTYLAGDHHHRLRFPVSDEYAFGEGTRQDFQGGHLTWTAADGVRIYAE